MTAFPSSRRQYRGQPSGVGIREENFADGAGHRLVTATYTFNTIQSVLQSNLGQLKTLNGTQDFSGGTLPFNLTIADQYISVPMGLTMAFTSSAVAGARTLTGRIYGKNQFGQDVVEDGVIVNAGGGAVTTIALSRIFSRVTAVQILARSGVDTGDRIALGPHPVVNPLFGLPIHIQSNVQANLSTDVIGVTLERANLVGFGRVHLDVRSLSTVNAAESSILLPVGLVPSSEWFVLNLICRTSRGQAMSRARVGYANLKPW